MVDVRMITFGDVLILMNGGYDGLIRKHVTKRIHAFNPKIWTRGSRVALYGRNNRLCHHQWDELGTAVEHPQRLKLRSPP